MSVVAAAVIGSAVAGGVAADRAADKQASATKKGLEQSGALANRARQDAINLYQAGRESFGRGIQSTLDYYKRASPARYSPLIQGNVAAQQVIGQGAAQANNAILGLPVNMDFAQPQQINPSLGQINAQLPAQSTVQKTIPSILGA